MNKSIEEEKIKLKILYKKLDAVSQATTKYIKYIEFTQQSTYNDLINLINKDLVLNDLTTIDENNIILFKNQQEEVIQIGEDIFDIIKQKIIFGRNLEDTYFIIQEKEKPEIVKKVLNRINEGIYSYIISILTL